MTVYAVYNFEYIVYIFQLITYAQHNAHVQLMQQY